MDVDHLVSVAQQLAARVRDDDPVANQRWLHAMLPDPAEREALCYVLAAAVPDDQCWTELVGWAQHGTGPGAARHEERGEHLCDACRSWAAEPVSTGISTTRDAAETTGVSESWTTPNVSLPRASVPT